MEPILYLLAGLVVGIGIMMILKKSHTASSNMLFDLKEKELQDKEKELQDARLKADQQTIQLDALREHLTAITADNKSKEREIQLLHEQMDSEKKIHAEALEKQLSMVKEQLKNTTQELLGQRAFELQKENKNQMDAILNPLRESIKDMKTSMDSSRETSIRTTSSLEKKIEEIMKHTADIGNEADKLADALKNKNKVQGGWGEVILNEILDNEGLTKGIHYETQETLRDESGRAVSNDDSGAKMRPDVILHYPDGKDAVIDAKVSLSAFVDYQNAENAEERQDALNRHIKSIKAHVNELSLKKYNQYIKKSRQSLSYVIMFVPNESALQLALYNESTLWRDAFKKNVFITGEQNLVAVLRLIMMAWTQTLQAENQEKIVDAARKLLNNVMAFYETYEQLGNRMKSMVADYNNGQKKLYNSPQSVKSSAERLMALGAKPDSNKKNLLGENAPKAIEFPEIEEG